MTRRMLIDSSHAEQTRVVIMEDDKLLEFDSETGSQRTLKGNIYLAKITRVEPSLQAAFVDYGGNRHGFLPFSEIHPDYYRIPVADREALLAEQARSHRSSEFDETSAGDDDEAFDDDEDALESNDADIEARDFDGDDDPQDLPVDSVDDAGNATRDNAIALSNDPDDAVAVADPAEDGEVADADGDDSRSGQRRNGRGRGNGRGRDDRKEQDRRRSARLRRSYTIQEVIKRGQIMLVQVVKEERGTKGAAVTTYLSLAGRYCVLMPNTARGGGISRKITIASDRKRLKSIVDSLEIPSRMAVIVRTAGIGRTKPDIKRDFDYLAKTWEQIREVTLQSRAPALIYEESQLIKRVLRDSYTREIEEVLVEGDAAYREAKDFMKTLMPSHAKRVQPYRESSPPLFHRFKVDAQLEHLHSPIVQLRSGGYLVINLTEALVAIDVNSGRATRERHIEETALKTNLEAADEIARQLRLRDLAGLVVVDFIDMEDRRNNAAVERRFKDALRHDRARVQTGRISQLGLLEMSRQRLRPSLLETMMQPCPHCQGTGRIHSTGTSALYTLRALEDHGLRGNAGVALVTTAPDVAFYILNDKRAELARFERDYNLYCRFEPDATLVAPEMRFEMLERTEAPALNIKPLAPPHPLEDEDLVDDFDEIDDANEAADADKQNGSSARADESSDDDDDRRRRGRRGGRRRRLDDSDTSSAEASGPIAPPSGDDSDVGSDADDVDSRNRNRRRRRRSRPEGRSLPGVAVFAKSALPLALHVAPEPQSDKAPKQLREDVAQRDEPTADENRPAKEEKPAPRRRSRRGGNRSQRRSGEASERHVEVAASVEVAVANADNDIAVDASPQPSATEPSQADEPDAIAVSAEEPLQTADANPPATADTADAQNTEPAATQDLTDATAADVTPEPDKAQAPDEAQAPQVEAVPEAEAEAPADEPASAEQEVLAQPDVEPEPETKPAPEREPELELAGVSPDAQEPAAMPEADANTPKRPRRRGWWQRLLE